MPAKQPHANILWQSHCSRYLEQFANIAASNLKYSIYSITQTKPKNVLAMCLANVHIT